MPSLRNVHGTTRKNTGTSRPPVARNSFFLFKDEFGRREKNNGWKGREPELIIRASRAWKTLPPKEKDVYHQRHREEKLALKLKAQAESLVQHPDLVYTPAADAFVPTSHIPALSLPPQASANDFTDHHFSRGTVDSYSPSPVNNFPAYSSSNNPAFLHPNVGMSSPYAYAYAENQAFGAPFNGAGPSYSGSSINYPPHPASDWEYQPEMTVEGEEFGADPMNFFDFDKYDQPDLGGKGKGRAF